VKKVLLFSVLFIALFVTGCGGSGSTKKLVCSQKVQTVDVQMLADFDGDTLTALGLKYEMDLSAYNDAQIGLIGAQDMCATVKTSMASYTNAFTNCKQKIDNKVLIITADFDLDKLITGDIKKEAKIEDVKAGLEKQNYKCTIN
jgi:hypothetical protein